MTATIIAILAVGLLVWLLSYTVDRAHEQTVQQLRNHANTLRSLEWHTNLAYRKLGLTQDTPHFVVVDDVTHVPDSEIVLR